MGSLSRRRAGWAGLAVAALGGAGIACAPEPAGDCGFGERFVDGACTRVDYFQLNLDERTDRTLADTSRRGIGVNGCTFRADTLVADEQDENCAVATFDGEFSSVTFDGDAGRVTVGLAASPIAMTPSGDGCYSSDLNPARGDLFDEGEQFVVEGAGGDDFPAFTAELTAPAVLVMTPPERIARGEDLSVAWDAGEATHLLLFAHTYDEARDEATNIFCLFDDDGAGLVPGSMTARLQAGDDDVELFFLRQSWAHLEPADAEVAIDVVASQSIAVNVPLLDAP